METYKRDAKPNGLLRKLRAKTCELCGAVCDDIEIHQVKRLKDLTGNTAWEEAMEPDTAKHWRFVLPVLRKSILR